MKSILLVEDSAADLFCYRRVLRKLMPTCELHEFVFAEDALEFLKRPDRPRFDLVLVDINMPRMDGFEFSDAYLELQSDARGSAPVYMISSSIDPEDQARADAHPAIAGFVQKPLTVDQIGGLI